MLDTELPLAEAWHALRTELVDAGHLIPTGVRGVYGRGGAFEGVVEALPGRGHARRAPTSTPRSCASLRS